MGNEEEIFKKVKAKEERMPDYAEDLAIKRAEGIGYECSIVNAFNKLSDTLTLKSKSDHWNCDHAGFFTTFDADLYYKDKLISKECELKGRPQWTDGEFPYDSVVINVNKIMHVSDKSLLIYCNKDSTQFMWFWNMSKIMNFTITKDFQIRRRAGMQKNDVFNIPMAYMKTGLPELISFLEKTCHRS